MPDDWKTASELAGLPGMPGSVFRTRDWLERNNIPRRRRAHGKGLEYSVHALPPATLAATILECGGNDAALNLREPSTPAAIPSPPLNGELVGGDLPQSPAPLEALSSAARAEATRRAAACLAVRAALDRGDSAAAAISRVAAARSVSAATLKKWWLRVRALKPSGYAETLAPRRGGVRESTRAGISGEAWEFIKADYLRPERPCLNTCYWRLLRVAHERGWAVPSYRTIARRIESLPWQVISLAREGEDGLVRRLPVMTRTRGHLQPMQAVNADGHTFDVRVVLPSGAVGRPVLTAWQDLYSGKIVAWRLGETLNQHLVRLAFGDMVEAFGVPGHAFLDNGREFANKWLTGGSNFRFRFTIREEDPIGIFAQMGVEVHWTTPYHGQSKPIERAFRDLCEEIAKHPANHGAYTGNSPVAKPANYGSRAVKWDDFHALVASEIAAHNARPGRRTETARGRSFDETFSEAYARATVTRATAEQRRLWLLAAEGVTVRQTGHVAIMGNAYWGEALPPLAGRKVVVRFDPERLDLPVAVYDADGALLCEAARTAAAFDDAAAAKEHARANRQRVKAARAQLDAERTMRALEAAAMLRVGQPAAGDGTPAPAAVRMLAQKRKQPPAQEPDEVVSELVRAGERYVLDSLDDWKANRFALGSGA